MNRTHAEFANDLRDLADFIQAHPELPVPAYAVAATGILAPKVSSTDVLAAAGQRDVKLSRFCRDEWEISIDIASLVTLSVSVDPATLVPSQSKTVFNYELPRVVVLPAAGDQAVSA